MEGLSSDFLVRKVFESLSKSQASQTPTDKKGSPKLTETFPEEFSDWRTKRAGRNNLRINRHLLDIFGDSSVPKETEDLSLFLRRCRILSPFGSTVFSSDSFLSSVNGSLIQRKVLSFLRLNLSSSSPFFLLHVSKKHFAVSQKSLKVFFLPRRTKSIVGDQGMQEQEGCYRCHGDRKKDAGFPG